MTSCVDGGDSISLAPSTSDIRAKIVQPRQCKAALALATFLCYKQGGSGLSSQTFVAPTALLVAIRKFQQWITRTNSISIGNQHIHLLGYLPTLRLPQGLLGPNAPFHRPLVASCSKKRCYMKSKSHRLCPTE
jgi:hypothetical protein